MRILNIVDEFYPEAGYENNILSKYFVLNGHEYIIFTTKFSNSNKSYMSFFPNEDIEKKDENFHIETGVDIIRMPFIAHISGRIVWHYSKLIRQIKKINPDIIFFCGNDTLIAMQYIFLNRNLSIPIITDSHMLAMASKNKFADIYRFAYKKLITPYIIKNNIKVLRLQDDNYVEKYLGIPLSQCPFISFGSDILLFNPDKNVRSDFRKQNGITENDFVVVYTGKLDEAKGGKLLAETFLKKFNTDKNVVLVVVGTMTGDYGKELEILFSKSDNKVLRFPTQKYMDLPKFYQMADLCVFAKQCSLSFYDAQACGLPVLSEDNNINVDRCSHNNGWNFKSGDLSDFKRQIEFILNMPTEKFKMISNNAYKYIIENYNYADKAKEYEKILLSEYKRFHKTRSDKN